MRYPMAFARVRWFLSIFLFRHETIIYIQHSHFMQCGEALVKLLLILYLLFSQSNCALILNPNAKKKSHFTRAPFINSQIALVWNIFLFFFLLFEDSLLETFNEHNSHWQMVCRHSYSHPCSKEWIILHKWERSQISWNVILWNEQHWKFASRHSISI